MENEETMNDAYENPLSDRNTEVLNGSFSPSELEQFANLGQTDKQFSIFRKTIANSSDQVKTLSLILYHDNLVYFSC